MGIPSICVYTSPKLYHILHSNSELKIAKHRSPHSNMLSISHYIKHVVIQTLILCVNGLHINLNHNKNLVQSIKFELIPSDVMDQSDLIHYW